VGATSAAIGAYLDAQLPKLKVNPVTSVLILVIPAQAGTQWHRFSAFTIELTFARSRDNRSQSHWVPACAGMTSRKAFRGSLESLMQRSGIWVS
jgi:hypothetical protein